MQLDAEEVKHSTIEAVNAIVPGRSYCPIIRQAH